MPTSFSHIDLCLVTFPLPLLQLLQNCYCYFCHRHRYFHTTLLLNILLQILNLPGVVELTTQLLILESILWLPLCRINKFGLNTLPSKTVAIPYTCGLSRPFSGAVAGEHSSILGVTWDLYMLITMKNLKDTRNKITLGQGAVRNCHLALYLIQLLFWVSLRHHHLLLILICHE